MKTVFFQGWREILGLGQALLLCLVVQAVAGATRYVDSNSLNPDPPYTTWATAARIIQDAIDVSSSGDKVLVTNGVYATGGAYAYSSSNRVAVTKPIALLSINGPQSTAIVGDA